jgi:hypothetical protein
MPYAYKDTTKYENGMLLLLRNFRKLIPNAFLRIHYDSSVLSSWKHIIDEAKQLDHVELVYYDFPQFKKDGYHNGVFGTILRLFPLFKFTDLQETICIIDIDFESIEELSTVLKNAINSIKKLNKHKLQIMFTTYGYRADIRKTRLMLSDFTKKYKFKLRFLIQLTIFTIKIDSTILVKFMKCLLEKCITYKSWINDMVKKLKFNKQNNKKRDIQFQNLYDTAKHDAYIILFGTDELFLNTDIAEYFIKTNTSFLISYKLPSITKYNFMLYRDFFMEKRLDIQFILRYYKYVLENDYIYEKKPINSVYTNFLICDKRLYSTNKTTYNQKPKQLNTPEAEKTKKRMYNFLLKAVKTGQIYNKNMDPEDKLFLDEIIKYKYESLGNKYVFYKVSTKKKTYIYESL